MPEAKKNTASDPNIREEMTNFDQSAQKAFTRRAETVDNSLVANATANGKEQAVSLRMTSSDLFPGAQSHLVFT